MYSKHQEEQQMNKKQTNRGRFGLSGTKAWLMAMLAALFVAGAAFAGCSSDDDGDSGSDGGSGDAPIAKFSVVTPEKGNDFGWYQQAVEGSEAVGAELGIEVEVADNSGYEDVTPILRELATSGSEFVIAQASGYNTAAPDVADQTGVPMMAWDNPEATVAPYSANATTKAQDGAYLAGILAAKTTKKDKLGIVISADDANWNRQSGGFIVGARSVTPDIDIELAQIGQAGYADTAGGKRVTEALIADGADIIFGMGDGSSFGMLNAVENAGGDVKFIDVIGDKSSIAKGDSLLSSVLWDFQGVYKEAIEDIGNETFGESEYVVTLENGIALLRTPQIADDVWSEIEDARQQIIDGDIEVPFTDTKSKVDSLLKG
jgi:simple sugar transport system substrate-binding protein